MKLSKLLPKRIRHQIWLNKKKSELEKKALELEKICEDKLRAVEDEDEKEIIKQELSHYIQRIENEADNLIYTDIAREATDLGIKIPKEWVENYPLPVLNYEHEAELRDQIIQKKRDNTVRTVNVWIPILALIVSIGGLVASVAISYVSIKQTSKNLEIAQNSLYLSAQPSVEVIYDLKTVTIQNTSQYPIVGVTTKIMAYSVDNQSNKIAFRQDENGNDMNFPLLKPKEKASISNLAQVIKERLKYEDDLGKEGMHTEFAIVIYYHRETDQKSFVKIEPFTLIGNASWFEIIPTIFCKKCGRLDNPNRTIELVEEITRIEKVYFRVDN